MIIKTLSCTGTRKALLGAALLLCGGGMASAQAVIFPQETQAGTAQSQEGDDEGVIILSNQLLTATFINNGGKLTFGGCPEMGLNPGTELFTVTLQDGTQVKASEMTVSEWMLESLGVDNEAAVGSKKIPGQSIKATLTHGDLTFEWRAVLRDGSHYLRTELAITAAKDVAMHAIVPMIYEVANDDDVPEVTGNTRGAVLASSKIFAGLETPTGINSVEDPASEKEQPVYVADEGFRYNG